LRLETPITSSCVNQVKRGMSVNVNLDNAGQKLIGKIDEIVPEIDPQTRTQTIKIGLPANKGLQQGQFAWLELACQAQENALLIPLSAVLQYGQLQAVNIVKDGKLQTRHIRTGKENNQQIEVLSGLHEGDIILLNNGL
jgi:multidrug efflux pump subunit AcrA (membrane-fusion protein)